ncbi:L-rhamnose mutarotase [Marinivivus vitaminiproducens]|uniref:L-rhamnose mutarotase n=1 Tax=Marinivivus vitaminiproducens TaxID=3035935 RepID=UPI00279AF7D6|nr:L-rhamnose mutarotase [Geminicoccaceae bacterium SCSIO 64248]
MTAGERIAFRMQLDPGQAETYKARHDAIWPELTALLKDAGISDYSIFLDPETNALFAVLRRTAGHGMDDLPKQEIMRRWWTFMADIMATEADGSPVSRPLLTMFHME